MKECFCFGLLRKRRKDEAVVWGKLHPGCWHILKQKQNTKHKTKTLCCHWNSDSAPAAVQCYCCLELSDHVLWMWLAGPGLLLLLSLPVSASSPPALPPPPSPVLPTNHNWQGTNRTLSAPMEKVVSTCLGQRRGQGAGEVRIEGGIRLQVAAAVATVWGKILPKGCSRSSRVQCIPAPLDSFHTLKALSRNRRKLYKTFYSWLDSS